MSTDARARSRTRRRSRAFAISFTLVALALAAVGLAGAAASVAIGPRVTGVSVDPAAASAVSGSRLVVTTSQPLAEVDAAQVTVTPEAPFAVDTAGRSVGVRFGLPLRDDTEYTVRFDDVHGVGGGPSATITQTFRTPPAELFLLQRSASGDDTIFRADLGGEAAVPVFTHPHIEDYRATGAHLVVSVRGDDTAELIVIDHDGEGSRTLPLPGNGHVSNLQAADRGELIGYTYSDADLGPSGGIESALFTASLRPRDADAAPTPVAVAGVDARTAEWRFVPDSDSILLLTFDSALLLADAEGGQATALGSAIAISGIAPGTSQAVVERAEGLVVIDLTDASEAPLAAAAESGIALGPVLPVPGGGTLRILSQVDDAGRLAGTSVEFADDEGASRPLLALSSADAVLHVCVSPSGRYAAVLVAPDAVSNAYDRYRLPLPGRLETRIVEVDDGAAVVDLEGFDISWCRLPPS